MGNGKQIKTKKSFAIFSFGIISQKSVVSQNTFYFLKEVVSIEIQVNENNIEFHRIHKNN